MIEIDLSEDSYDGLRLKIRNLETNAVYKRENVRYESFKASNAWELMKWLKKQNLIKFEIFGDEKVLKDYE